MTYLPVITGVVSDTNSSTQILGAATQFVGVGFLCREYASVSVSTQSDTGGHVSVEFSGDNTNWDVKRAFVYSLDTPEFSKQLLVEGLYCRVVFTNGTTAQTVFRLQTRFHVSNVARDTEQLIDCSPDMKDAFGRLRISTPYTLLDVTHTQGINTVQETELIEGGGITTHQSDSGVLLSVDSAGDRVVRQSRARAVCPPGKSILVLLTGVLNVDKNKRKSKSRLGYFDDANGVFVEYGIQKTYVVSRTSVSGQVVDTKVNQEDWNGSSNVSIDLSKRHVFFFDLQWLGVGLVKFGIIVNGQPLLLHTFNDANLQYASLPTRYEISSTNGSGSMVSYASSVISEGGYLKPGAQVSANIGTQSRILDKDVRIPLFSMRLTSGSLANVRVRDINILRLDRYDGLWEIYLFRDMADSLVLTAPNFVSKSNHVECDFEATGVDVSGGMLLTSGYYSGSNDTSVMIDAKDINSVMANNISDVSDLFVFAYTAISGRDSALVSLSWREYL